MKIKKIPVVRHNKIPPPQDSSGRLFSCVDKIFDCFSGGLRLIGPSFAFAVIIFIMICTHAYFNIILPYWLKKVNVIICLLLTFTGLFFLFSIIFNYILAVIVKPCTLEDLANSKYYQKVDPLTVPSSIINFSHILSNPLNKLTIPNNNTYEENLQSNDNPTNPLMTLDNTNCIPVVRTISPEEQNNQFSKETNYPECKYCKQFKPIRAHHCSVCNICIFKMDHHCPWINNCIGQNNQRYFLLFLIHVQFGTLFMIVMSIPLWLNLNISRDNVYLFISVLSVVAFIIASFFSTWQLKLVLKGRTSIEHWCLTSNTNLNQKINDFSLNNWRENLFLVFGTRSLFKALFIPNIKKLPYSGLEWTKIAYPDFQLTDIIETKSTI